MQLRVCAGLFRWFDSLVGSIKIGMKNVQRVLSAEEDYTPGGTLLFLAKVFHFFSPSLVDALFPFFLSASHPRPEEFLVDQHVTRRFRLHLPAPPPSRWPAPSCCARPRPGPRPTGQAPDRAPAART